MKKPSILKKRELERNTYSKISMKLKRLTKSYNTLRTRLMTAAEVNEKDEAELKKTIAERDDAVQKLSDATG